MEPILLITKSDFSPYVDLSSNLDVKKLNNHIEHAQEFDLRPLLGDLMFYDLLNKKAEQKYIDLLTGKEYEVQGVNITFKGLKPVLVHFAAARLAPNLDKFFSATGMVVKLNDLSNPVDPKEISRIVQTFESLAIGYFNKAKSFLDLYASDYSLWNRTNCASPSGSGRKSGARIYGLNG